MVSDRSVWVIRGRFWLRLGGPRPNLSVGMCSDNYVSGSSGGRFRAFTGGSSPCMSWGGVRQENTTVVCCTLSQVLGRHLAKKGGSASDLYKTQETGIPLRQTPHERKNGARPGGRAGRYFPRFGIPPKPMGSRMAGGIAVRW